MYVYYTLALEHAACDMTNSISLASTPVSSTSSLSPASSSTADIVAFDGYCFVKGKK
jgi:hypothetical protein